MEFRKSCPWLENNSFRPVSKGFSRKARRWKDFDLGDRRFHLDFMTVKELASILDPLLTASPNIRVVLQPCEPDGAFVDVESAETVEVDPETKPDMTEKEAVLIIN
ncbi:MAG: hypothetical protein V4819_11285 [Verrucomicrobiota bacterium]